MSKESSSKEVLRQSASGVGAPAICGDSSRCPGPRPRRRPRRPRQRRLPSAPGAPSPSSPSSGRLAGVLSAVNSAGLLNSSRLNSGASGESVGAVASGNGWRSRLPPRSRRPRPRPRSSTAVAVVAIAGFGRLIGAGCYGAFDGWGAAVAVATIAATTGVAVAVRVEVG